MDLRRINQSCEELNFQYEDINTVIDYVQPHDQLITLDIKNGYHHIPVALEHQQYLGISFQGRYFVWQVLPFGLSSSPYFFCKTVCPIIQYLRLKNIRLSSYVDDFILLAQKQCMQSQRSILDTLRNLGWVINVEKSSLNPGSTKTFIGYKITTGDKPILRIPNERIHRLRKDIKRALAQQHVSARILARIAGQCVSMAKAVLPAKLLLRSTYRLLASKKNGAPIHTGPVDFQMETDASMTGWGAMVKNTNQAAAGFWNHRLSQMPSNYREMMAVLLGLKSLTFPTGKRIQVLTDNITTSAYINHLGGPSQDLSQLASAIAPYGWKLTTKNSH